MDQYVTKQYLNEVLTREFTRSEKKLRAEFRMDIEETVSRWAGIMMEHTESLVQRVAEVNSDHGRHIKKTEERLDNHEPRIKRLEIITA